MSWLEPFFKHIKSRNEEPQVTESRNEEPQAAPSILSTEDVFGISRDSSSISIDGSLGLSAVWACVRILSETIGSLPVHLYKRTDDGRNQVSDHAGYLLLKNPNDYSGQFDIIQALIMHFMLWGNGYLRIYRDANGAPIELELLEPALTTPYLTTDRKLYYHTGSGEVLPSDDVIHIKNLSTNGFKGRSPISIHRENLTLGKSVQSYGGKFFSQGGNMTGVFTVPETLDQTSYDRLKEDLYRRTIGLDNSHKPLVLEGGLTYQRISIPPEDAQFIATRTFQKTEIATIFGVPPHMIGDLERSTNNNIEHQGMEFVRYCLTPHLVRLEEQFNRKLLKYSERGQYYFKFTIDALLRGDLSSRTTAYRTQYYMGAISANEIRALEERNSYEGGDKFYRQSNMEEVTAKPQKNE